MPLSLEHDLSEELLDNIISMSCPDSLTRICRTSKKLNRIGTPHLYRTVFFDNGTLDQGVKHLLPFTFLVFSSPSHASFVQSLAIRNTWGEDAPVLTKEEEIDPNDKYDKRPWPKYNTPELEVLLRKKSAEYAVDEKEADDIYEKIKTGANENMVMALLLSNLPNLRTLDISLGTGLELAEFSEMIDRVADRVKPFDKLPSEVEFNLNEKSKVSNSTGFSIPLDLLITSDNDKYPNDTDSLALMLKLPNIRSLYGWKMGDEGDPEEGSAFKKLKPRSCPVEYLELRTSKLHSDHLQLLMDATIPGKLKTFSYEIGCTWAWVNVEHVRIMKSLEAHHDTLECLALSHEEFFPYQFDNEDERPDPVTFNSFKTLKKLKLAPVYIWGHEGFCTEDGLKNPETKEWLWKGLPETLEELWITRALDEQGGSAAEGQTVRFIPDQLIPALELVVQYKSQAYPKLSCLRVEFQLSSWKDEWIELLASLCRQAEQNGIPCQIILTDDQQMGYTLGNYTERGWGWNEDVEWQECMANQEPPKIWIDAAKEEDLGGRLVRLKNEQNGIKRKSREMLKANRNRDGDEDEEIGGAEGSGDMEEVGEENEDEGIGEAEGSEDMEEVDEEDEDDHNAENGSDYDDEGNNSSGNVGGPDVDVKRTRGGTTY